MRKSLFFIFLSLGLFISCSDESGLTPDKDVNSDQIDIKSSNRASNFVVPLEIANTIAADYVNTYPEHFVEKGETPLNREIEGHYVIPDSEGLPALYVINYKNDLGYLVISGDWRHEPICAVAKRGKFPDADAPSMLVNWFETTVKHIEFVRYFGFDNTKRAKDDWIKLSTETSNSSRGGWTYPECCEECPNWPDCFVDNISCGYGPAEEYCDPVWDEDPCGSYTTTIVGPLMSTTWGQGCGYNDQVPNLNCNDICAGNTSNTRAWTGCVATGMAQVIRYWSISSSQSYNYGSMPNNSGNSEVQRLMSDAGESVDMDYGCSGSGADSDDIPDALKDDFNFSTADRNNYSTSSYLTVVSNINGGKPVLLDGCRTKKSFLGIKWYKDCHLWVCDGHKKTKNNCYSYLDLHMNWGWSGTYNGWYKFNNWTMPNGWNYQYAQDYIHNIEP